MRRWMSLMLILLLAVGLCIPAVAQGTTPKYTETPTATFKVNYTVPTGQDWTKRPVADFAFTIQADGTHAEQSGAPYPADLPTISVAQFTSEVIAKGESGKTLPVTITLPDTYTNVGVYKYTITQTDPKISGVTCHTKPIRLTVQVIWDENEDQIRVAAVHCEATGSAKSDEITNTYNSGSLAITKKVTGNMGDQEQYFAVDVSLGAVPASTTAASDSPVSITGGSYEGQPANPTTIAYGETKTIYIRHDDTITLSNIVAGVTYTVTEHDYRTGEGTGFGYDAAKYTRNTGSETETAPSGTITSNTTDTVKIVNNKGYDVDTGISLDNAPYLLLLAVVVAAGAMLLLKRRHREKD